MPSSWRRRGGSRTADRMYFTRWAIYADRLTSSAQRPRPGGRESGTATAGRSVPRLEAQRRHHLLQALRVVKLKNSEPGFIALLTGGRSLLYTLR